MKIVILGLGYIGLPTASMLANKGHQVLGVDTNSKVVDTINAGCIHIVEPDLDILVRAAVNSGNLTASMMPKAADVFIIAVPTPFSKSQEVFPHPDLAHVEQAALAIAPVLRPGNLVVLESTSPVGTTDRVRDLILAQRPDLCAEPGVYFAHCPERVLPGCILRELVDNDRIIGGVDSASAEKARDLYQSFCNGEMVLTDARTAEMTKLTENAFRDVNIAFANELSLICDRLDINVRDLISLANRHPRVNILKPGPGVGGHCIAVDPWFIVSSAPEQARLIRAAREVNDAKPGWVLDKIRSAARAFHSPTIGCLGLTFKANVDDLRESPSLRIVRSLRASGIGQTMVCEPHVNGTFDEFKLHTLEEVLEASDILVALVDHAVFKAVDRRRLVGKVVLDTCGTWSA